MHLPDKGKDLRSMIQVHANCTLGRKYTVAHKLTRKDYACRLGLKYLEGHVWIMFVRFFFYISTPTFT